MKMNVLKLPAVLPDGKPGAIYPVLLSDNGESILVDAGFPGQLKQFKDAFKVAGIGWNSLKTIIITHHDIDHIGSLPDIILDSPAKIEVISSELEKPYIRKDVVSYKAELLKKHLKTIPEDQKVSVRSMLDNFTRMSGGPGTDVARVLKDGEELPFCGGITVIYTPGHTPGHISLYLKGFKTLISGDALSTDGESLFIMPFPDFLQDNETARKSIRKLANYDIKTVVCYHGGICGNQVNRKIAVMSGKEIPEDNSMVRVFQTLAEYNQSANIELLNRLEKLPGEQLKLDTGAYYTSIYEVLNHILMNSDTLFLKLYSDLFPGDPALSGNILTGLDEEKYKELMEKLELDYKKIFVYRKETDGLIRRFMDKLTPEYLSSSVPLYQNAEGETVSGELWKTLLKLFDHQTYHRGEIAVFLDRMGIENDTYSAGWVH